MHPLLADRWSARGYDADATMSDEHLQSILEAGRWAPTGGGRQPVRFVVGRRGDPTFAGVTEALKRGNQSWAPAAAALIVLCTDDLPDDPKMHDYATLDVGLAAGQMIVQAQADGWNAHPMGGFRAPDLVQQFDIPHSIRPLLVLAIGRLADAATLPADIRERDGRERTRLPLSEIAFAETWGQPLVPENR